MTSTTEQDQYLAALEHLRGSGYEFAGFLSNHGPMASDALVELGAADTVVGWVDVYRTRLTAEPEVRERISADAASWRPALGDIARVADWTGFFRQEMSEAQWTDVLARWWPRLLPGLAAAATHGVIRTAHAIRAIDRGAQDDTRRAAEGGIGRIAGSSASVQLPDPLIDELAHGLGYWAARYQTLPGAVPDLSGGRGVRELMDRIADMTLTGTPVDPGIMGSLVLTGSIPGFTDAVADYHPEAPSVDDDLSALTLEAARSFVSHPGPGIPLVHSLTGPAAVRMVLPHLPEALHRPSLAMSWKVSASIIAAFAGPSVPAPDHALDGDELIGRVVEHGDEHVVKMAEACLRENARRPDPVYLQAAEKAMHLIGPLRR